MNIYTQLILSKASQVICRAKMPTDNNFDGHCPDCNDRKMHFNTDMICERWNTGECTKPWYKCRRIHVVFGRQVCLLIDC